MEAIKHDRVIEKNAFSSENISSKPRVEYNSLAIVMRRSESKCTERLKVYGAQRLKRPHTLPLDNVLQVSALLFLKPQLFLILKHLFIKPCFFFALALSEVSCLRLVDDKRKSSPDMLGR